MSQSVIKTVNKGATTVSSPLRTITQHGTLAYFGGISVGSAEHQGYLLRVDSNDLDLIRTLEARRRVSCLPNHNVRVSYLQKRPHC